MPGTVTTLPVQLANSMKASYVYASASARVYVYVDTARTYIAAHATSMTIAGDGGDRWIQCSVMEPRENIGTTGGDGQYYSHSSE
uniref:Uncharacterized protein n=2 Tax=Wuchereria bancrofti TaxID=6293 RepID=A0AAF5PZ26_WUCBA